MNSETTIPVPKIVGLVLTSDWFAGWYVSFLSEFLSIDMNFRNVPLKGDLSDWIEGLGEGFFVQWIPEWRSVKVFARLLELAYKLRNPNQVKELLGVLEDRCSHELVQHVVISCETRDFERLRTSIEQMATKAGFSEFSALALFASLRAVQAAMRCLVWYRISPLVLIEKARKGDRDATLDLIRIDRLFLVDACSQNVLRQVSMANDKAFTARLGRIESARPKFGRREACEFYFYTLALFRLRPSPRLRLAIDPKDKAFPKMYDFSKCFERRCKEIEAY